MKVSNFLRRLLLMVTVCLIFIYQGFGQLNARFSFTSSSGCQPFLLVLNSTSTSSFSIVNHTWRLLNSSGAQIGFSSGSGTANFSIDNPGFYGVRLTITDASGASDSTELLNFFQVEGRPIPVFNFTNPNGCPCNTVTVSNTSSPNCNGGSIDSVFFDWGDGVVDAARGLASFSHSYCLPGVYSPRVILRNNCSFGCIADTVYRNRVNIQFPPEIVSVTPNPANTVFCQQTSPPVTFSPNINLNGAANLTYQWLVNSVPSGSNPLFTRSFTVGTYNITLIVTNSATGCQDTFDLPSPVVVDNTPPNPTPTFSPATGCAPLTVNFTNGPGAPNSANWSFPGGIVLSQSGTSARVQYPAQGTYSFSVSNVYGAGCASPTANFNNVITVTPAPVAQFSVTGDSLFCDTPAVANFIYTGTPCPGCTFSWNFGAGASPVTFNGQTPPPVTYRSFGAKRVSLTVTSPGCAPSTLLRTTFIRVDSLRTSFSYTRAVPACPPANAFLNTNIVFSPGDSLNSISYVLSGPAVISRTISRNRDTVSIPAAGCYDLSLFVLSARGCRDTLFLQDTVCFSAPPQFSYSVTPDSACYEATPQTFTFNITPPFDRLTLFPDSALPLPPVVFTGPTLPAPYDYQYTDLGVFTPRLVIDNDGCLDTLTGPQQIYILGPAAAYRDSGSCAQPLVRTYINQSTSYDSISWTFYNGLVTNQQRVTITYPAFGSYPIQLCAYNDTTGCIHCVFDTIVIRNQDASFVADDTFGCAPFRTILRNTTGNSFSFNSTRWDLDLSNGMTFPTTFRGDTLVANFPNPGVYSIAMRNTSRNNCLDTAVRNAYITVTALDASFSLSDTFGCAPLNVGFQNTSTTQLSTVTITDWDFNDPLSGGQNFSIQPNPNHTFNNNGVYNVRLMVEDNSGCRDSAFRQVQVTRLGADFSISDTLTCPNSPTPVVLSDLSSGQNYGRIWSSTPPANFSSNSAGVVNATFPAAGIYTIRLIIFDNNGVCAGDTVERQLRVVAPVANYTVAPGLNFACPPRTLSFTNTSTGDIVSVIWDLGNNTIINASLNDPITGPLFNSVSTIYSTADTFPIQMIVTSADGCVDTLIRDSVIIAGPSANIVPGPLGSCPPAVIGYTVCAWNTSPGGQFFTGCGPAQPFGPFPSPGTEANPNCVSYSFNFPNPVNCPPSLLLSDGAGCQVLTTGNAAAVYIDSPAVRFNFSTAGLCDTGTVCFQDSTTYMLQYPPNNSFLGGGRSFFWEFGDGDTSTQQNPCHYYAAPGLYRVRLTVEALSYCVRFAEREVYIPGNPVADFRTPDTIGCLPGSTQFFDQSVADTSAGLTFWQWSFGPAGANSILQNPSYTFPAVGNYTVSLTVIDSNGCSSDTSKVFNVFQRPPVFTSNDTLICEGGIANLSGGGAAFCFWSPGNLVADSTNCSTTASPTSDQSFILSVYANNGCPSFDSVRVRINGLVANFVADTVCQFDQTSFTDSSQVLNSVITNWLWDFGDGSAGSVLRNPIHTFPVTTVGQVDSFLVSLTITSGIGCTEDTSIWAFTSIAPQALFSAVPVCYGDTTAITDLSSPGFGNITRWIWTWGDGTVDTLAANSGLSHYYQNPGIYNVRLNVINNGGCDADTTIQVQVYNLPVSRFAADTACFGHPTAFTDISTRGSGTVISNYWDFDFPSPASDTSTQLGSASYIFPTDGFHPVYLLVRDDNGCEDDTVANIIVYTNPVAAFTVNNACTDSRVRFSSQTTPGTNNIANSGYVWDAGFLGGSMTGTNPTIVYPDSGIYQVTLTVTDLAGCADTLTTPVRINLAPVAAFSLADSAVCLNQAALGTDLSVPGESAIATWIWDFDSNGTTDDTNQNGTYLYPSPGPYDVILTVSDQNACTDTAIVSLTVNQIPAANFAWNVSCEEDPMNFISTTVPGDGALNSFLWTFNDLAGPVTDVNNPTSYTFNAGGNYNVDLVAGDVNGCFDTITQVVQVDSFPELFINPGDTTVCLGSSIQYQVNGLYDTIRWFPETWIDNPASGSPNITPLGTTLYTIVAGNGVCEPTQDSLLVDVIQPIPIELMAVPDRMVLGVSSNITSAIGGIIDSIVWSPFTSLDCRNCLNPVATPTESTTYTATIFYSRNGVSCTNQASIAIELIQTCTNEIIYVPNTFTPNEDGLNDKFGVRGLGINKINYFRVFDRWGRLVFETENVLPNSKEAFWDGNTKNGKPENPGVYVYMYELVCGNNDVVNGKGNITLIR